MFYFAGCANRLASEQLRFTQLGFPIRKSPDHRLLRTSPRHIVATPRPSSPFLVKASTIYPYANHPNADFIHHKMFCDEIALLIVQEIGSYFSEPIGKIGNAMKQFAGRELSQEK